MFSAPKVPLYAAEVHSYAAKVPHFCCFRLWRRSFSSLSNVKILLSF